MHAPATPNNIELLKIDNIICRADAQEGGIIKYVAKSSDGISEKIVAIGYFLSYLLGGHIVKETFAASGSAENAIRQLISRTVLDKNSDDYLPSIKLGSASGITATVPAITIEYEDLLEALARISTLSGVGYRLRPDLNSGTMIFECYEPKDRSVAQTENPQIIFSEKYETILSAPSSVKDDTQTVNAVCARYSGEYGEVVVNYNPSNASGSKKKETVISGLPITYTNAEGNIVLDVAATRASLLNDAKKAIKEEINSFSCSAEYAGNIEYKNSYDLGDVVTVEHEPWQISHNLRIHRITEVYEAAGTKIYPETGQIWPNGKE